MQLGCAGRLLSASDPRLGFSISSWEQRLGLPMCFLRIWFLARQGKPSAAWVESWMGMRATPCRCGRNSKALLPASTAVLGRFITISLGTHKCSQPLFFCSSMMSDRCCVGRWTSSQSPGGCLLSISISVSISFSPRSWGYSFASCLFYFNFVMCHTCLGAGLVWLMLQPNPHGSIFSSHQGKVIPVTCTQSSQWSKTLSIYPMQ